MRIESFYLHFAEFIIAEFIIAIDGFLIIFFHQRKLSDKVLQFHQKHYV